MSGMTNSVRESRNFTRAGYTYLDGRRIQSLKATVDMGKVFVLELRFPNGVTKSAELFVFPATRHTAKASRVTSPDPAEGEYKP